MDRQGRYRIAKQHANIGYYADVALVLSYDAAPGLRVGFADGVGVAWRAGATFGVAYAHEKSPLGEVRSKGVNVQITVIRGHAVDTTESLIALACAHAFWIAAGIEPSEAPALEESSARIVFPK